MNVGDPVYKKGQLQGYGCKDGHIHGSVAEATECTPEVWSVAAKEKNAQKEAERVRAIQDDPSYKQALAAAKELGATDDEGAEAGVLKNGIEPIMKALQIVRSLHIPKPKPAEPPKFPPKP